MNAMQGSSRFTGDYGTLPKRYQEAFRFGVNFFEIRWPGKAFVGHTITGPFDIRVKEITSPTGASLDFRVEELVGGRGQLRIDPVNGSGKIAIGWMYDDKYWHNRVYLLCNEWMYRGVNALHTLGGIINGDQVRMEIDCLREVTHQKLPIFSIMGPNGGCAGSYITKKQAEEELTEELKRQGGHIVEGFSLQWKPEVARLEVQYRNLEYGWTDCPEFRDRIIPEVKSLIAQKQGTMRLPGDQAITPESINEMIKQAIVNMPDDVLARLREKSHGDEPKLESDLSSKTNGELRDILWARGYQAPRTLNKAQLIELIQSPDVGSTKSAEQGQSEDAGAAFPFVAPVPEVIAQ